MTSLIKHDADPQKIRVFDWTVAPELAFGDPNALRLEAEVAALKQGARDTEAKHIAALEDARKQGRKDAEQSYKRNDEQALAALRDGVDTATEGHRARLKSLDAL